uniref:U3 small nucleolar RNA-associated protein 11 n=1 Tax=Nymphaea colorata TaxID=210225 RepID=A0A5K1HLZ6_9MAGN|nr:unnamed protein product [Nymphaea colorata]
MLEKKKDYQQRAKNFHKRQDMLNQLKVKADLKNEDEFYFQMMKGKRNQDGKFVQNDDDDDSDFDEKEYRNSLKTENYALYSTRGPSSKA